jgi:hypothetical protein
MQFEKVDSYQGIALAMPPKGRVFNGFSRWGCTPHGKHGPKVKAQKLCETFAAPPALFQYVEDIGL